VPKYNLKQSVKRTALVWYVVYFCARTNV